MRQFKPTERLTSRSSVSSSMYLAEVGPIPLLSAEEEVEMGLRAQKGDIEARDRLVRANLRFVLSVAKAYTTDPVMTEELVQAGNIGLIDAAGKFDPSRGFKFISFAVWHIRKEILAHLQKNSRMLTFPPFKAQVAYKLHKITTDLYNTLEREPTEEEIIEEFQRRQAKMKTHISMDVDIYREIVGADLKHASLDAKMTDESDSGTLGDTISSDYVDTLDRKYEVDHNKKVAKVLMKKLTPREEFVVSKRFGINGYGREHTMREIAEDLEISHEMVRNIFNKSLRKMRRGAHLEEWDYE